MSLPTTVIYNIVKLSYYFTQMTIALLKSKYKTIIAGNKILEEIVNSLSISLEVVLKILIRLGLETPEAL